MQKKDTSWEEVAVWYDSHLRFGDTYQEKVIAPHLARLLELSSDEILLDLGCGQGYFTHLFLPGVARVIGVDASETLLRIAKGQTKIEDLDRAEFFIAESHAIPMIADNSVHKILITLALQNIRECAKTFVECARVLKPSGSVHIVLNHPSFRIPKASGWRYDDTTKVLHREVSRYLSEFSSAIVMHPGSKEKRETTVSFHRPLEKYMEHARDAGLALVDLEEWASHKISQPGPRAAAEDRARREIPLFMYLQFKKCT